MDIEQLEAFAFGENRAEALDQLIAGTDEHYFYQCLLAQHEGRLAEVESILGEWIKQLGRTSNASQIELRQLLLGFSDHPDKTIAQLIKKLGLRFDHRRRIEGEKPTHPTRLDQSRISRDRWLQEALRRHPRTLRGLREAANEWLLGLETQLDLPVRLKLLQRINRPDHPKLLELIIEDLDRKKSPGFGSRPIHALLLEAQLLELQKKRPAVADSPAYVNARLIKLWPKPDVDWANDPKEKRAYLDRLWGYVRTLPSAFNSLLVHVLYHRLDLDRSEGRHDRALFMEYLRLPRSCHYVCATFLRSREQRDYVVSLGQDFRKHTQLAAVREDETLVRGYLSHFFEQESDYEAYRPYVAKSYLERWFALTKIARGIGPRDRWYALLDDPALCQRFNEQVEIDFCPDNKRVFAVDEPVRLAVELKNVPTLVVKVFEINTLSVFLESKNEVNTSVDLDGLVAREQHSYQYDLPSYRRARRSFDFASLDKPGTYVIELVGNGKSSRALIKKGGLRYVERLGAAGHVFTVFDEQNRRLNDATLWFGGRAYRGNEQGKITVPYSTTPGPAKFFLRHGGRSSLERFEHKSERYQLRATLLVDREQLKAKQQAQLLVRARLYLNDMPVSLRLLEEPTLVIHSRDRFDISSQNEVSDFALSAERESVYEFRVPEDLASIRFELRGKVKPLLGGDEISLSDSDDYPVNQIEQSDHTEALHLSRADEGAVLYLLGKTGEPRSHRPINLQLRHELFTDELRLTLQTDEEGRIELGELDGIEAVEARSPGGAEACWRLGGDGGLLPNRLHLRQGQTAAVAYVGPPIKRSWFQRLLRRPLRDAVSLLERRGGSFHEDWTDKVKLEDGYLLAPDLPAGEYDLLNKASRQSLTIRVSEGVEQDDWILSEHRLLQRSVERMLNISKVSIEERALRITLTGTSKASRLHVFANRFYTACSAGRALAKLPRRGLATATLSKALCQYVSGRDIGDEYRYILERQLAPKRAGNMLGRPGLLLNPWAVRKTDTGLDEAAAGEEYAASAARRPRAAPPPPACAAPQPSGVMVSWLIKASC